MKVFPLGWLRHELGFMYLFNQYRYPHAIINNTDQDRLVMAGKFCKDKVPVSVLQRFHANKKTYLDHWI
jgi:hypothetical protein